MDNEIQKLKTNEDNLKSKSSQQHDYKNVELRRSEDGKNPELKGDDGKLLKTHNVCLNTVAEKQQKKVNHRGFTGHDQDHGPSPSSWLHPPRSGGPHDPLRVVDHHTSRGKAHGGDTEPLGIRRQTTKPTMGRGLDDRLW
ncbi:hypothetical protein MTR67_025764 [Solanum verrucosum]|uniref:Uncharacterized protein n=1 Tax=Solanum verrucosum TaxID=315347 RepID=A0AAF0TU63_SOLVR|nr:hypothetical protein MTR67_025764 [Solanum verrucosum]